MNADRLEAWFAGELDDSDLTDDEVRWLDQAVLTAVAQKILAREGVHMFPEHRTLQ